MSIELLDVGDLRHAELLGQLRADLGGVAVDGLPAAEDDVRVELADRAGQDVAGGQRVAGGRPAVGDQDGPVGPADRATPQHVAGRRQAHRDDGHRAAEAVADLQRHLQGVEVLGVEDRRQGGPVDRAVVLHGLAGDPLGVRHLLDAYHAVIAHRRSFQNRDTERNQELRSPEPGSTSSRVPQFPDSSIPGRWFRQYDNAPADAAGAVFAGGMLEDRRRTVKAM